MKFLRFGLIAIAMCLTVMSFGQATARLQVIHNSPTPTVDVYVNGSILLNDFAYRTATPYVDVPAGVQLNIAVAPGNSRTVADALATFPVTLEAGKRYVAVAHGVVGNATTPFSIAVTDMGKETAAAGNVGIAFFHGSPNAPAVDIVTGGNVVFGNTSFGKFARPTAPYAEVPANATYRLTVNPAGTSTVVAAYDANLSFWSGKTAVVIATGFLGETNADKAFEPWVVLSNGGTFPLKAVPTTPAQQPAQAMLQVIHNSPTPTVDIYVNGNLLLDNFAFRTATPYIAVPAGVTLNIGVAGGNSRSASDAIATFPVKLDSGKTYVAIAHGVVGDAKTPFSIAVSDAGRMRASSDANVDVNFFHGTPDAPAVNINAGTSTIFGNVAFGKFGNYISVPANATYTLGVAAAAAPTNTLARYNMNLDFWKGKTAIVMATGFLGGGSPGFEPWVVLSNGGTFPLSAAPGFNPAESEVRNLQARKVFNNEFNVSPNPATDRVAVNFTLNNDAEVNFQILNTAGQVVKNNRFSTMGKGIQQVEIPVSDLNNGFYILRMESTEGVISKKLSINR